MVDVCKLLHEAEKYCFSQGDDIFKSLEDQYYKLLVKTGSEFPKAVKLAKQYSREKSVKIEKNV